MFSNGFLLLVRPGAPFVAMLEGRWRPVFVIVFNHHEGIVEGECLATSLGGPSRIYGIVVASISEWRP